MHFYKHVWEESGTNNGAVTGLQQTADIVALKKTEADK